MAKGVTKFVQFVNGHRTRICLSGEAVQVQLPKKTPTKGATTHPQEIELYPNYQIQDSQINLQTKKPNQAICQDLVNSDNLIFVSNCVFTQDPDNNQAEIEQLNNLSRHVVQLHYVEVFANAASTDLTGTGILIQHDEKYFILTCLHTFIPKRNQKGQIFITTSEIDEGGIVATCLQIFDRSPKPHGLLQFLKENIKNGAVWEANLDEDFLAFRKQWLEEIRVGDKYDGILDPLSKMKPSPAFDISLLQISEETKGDLLERGNSFYDLKGNSLSFL